MKQNTKISVTAAIGVTALIVTGCSSSPDAVEAGSEAPQRGVYEFQTPAYGSESDLTIQVPQNLKDAAPETKELLVTSVKAKAREMASAKYCAVDLAISYSGDATNTLTQPRVTQEEAAESAEQDLAEFSRRELGASTTEEFAENSKKRYGIAATEAEIASFESTLAKLRADYNLSGAGEVSETTPLENISENLTGSSWGKSISDFDETDPEEGFYLSDDYKTLTFVDSCAESPTDSSAAFTFNIPLVSSGQSSTFASFDMSAMKNGTLAVVESNIADYKLDTNGDWIAD